MGFELGQKRSFGRVAGILVALAALVAAFALMPSGATASDGATAAGKHHKGGKKKHKHFKVCKHGCRYRSIQKAVDKSGRDDVVDVKPGKYSEGVIVEGHKHDGLTIRGTGKDPDKVILDGTNAHNENGLAQNAIEGIDVNKLTMKNMWARNYATNGFFVHECRNYLMKNLLASYNRSYGMYAFNCVGGDMKDSTGWGHGDSAFYIGATPEQKNPRWSDLSHLDGHLNVLGYSGTNSRYVDIHDSAFYNNGVGVVPNTLDSEPFEPTSTGVIHDNDIFWNNFNYFKPQSPVKTVSAGLGTLPGGGTVQYPTGIGVVLFGATGWRVYHNDIFGHFKYGAAAFSNPFNEDDNAISTNNRFTQNAMGRGGQDKNAYDFWIDGSGKGNCLAGNQSSTFDPSPTASISSLYPHCPAPNSSGTGTSTGNPSQVAEMISYTVTDPPQRQECSWTKHAHPQFGDYEPYQTPGPLSCP